MSLDAVSSPSTGGASPFADAREAKEWLKLLPLINTQQSLLELSDALRQLNDSRLDAVELLKILELLRESIHTTQDGELLQYIGKPLPLTHIEMQHWHKAQDLWTLLETAYARCWRAAHDGNADITEHLALIAERSLRYGSYVARGYQLIYRQVPEEIWQRLFSRYQLAESAGVARTTVRDSLIEIHGTTMPQTMLVHALLLVAGESRKLTSKQMLWLDHRLEVLASRTSLAPQAPALPGKTSLQIDLAAPGPALRMSKPLSGTGVREIDTLVLAQVLSKRIKLLREGELPQKLGLGTEIGPQAAEALLTELYRRWCELPTPIPLRRKTGARFALAGLGIVNLHRLISSGGLPPSPEDNLSVDRRELEQIKLYGHTAASARTPVKHPSISEQWEILQETAQEYQLLRPAASNARIGLQQLVGIAPDGPFLLGIARSLEESGNQLQISVRLLPGEPQAVAARPIDLVRLGQSTYTEILLLNAAPALKAPPSLITPTGWYRQGRILDVWDGAHLYRVRLAQVLERGTDFERVLFAPAGNP